MGNSLTREELSASQEDSTAVYWLMKFGLKLFLHNEWTQEKILITFYLYHGLGKPCDNFELALHTDAPIPSHLDNESQTGSGTVPVNAKIAYACQQTQEKGCIYVYICPKVCLKRTYWPWMSSDFFLNLRYCRRHHHPIHIHICVHVHG